jgi:nucleotide-binding universal stress UspA family protein
MSQTRALSCAALAALLALACAHPQPKVLVPPRVNLSGFGTIGLIEFDSGPAHDAGALASREFLAAVQQAQPGVPVLELGDQGRVLSAVGHPALDPEAIRAIGEKYHVDAVVVGSFRTSGGMPSFSMSGFAESLSAGADLDGTLSARILETRAGATLWTRSAQGKEPLARVGLAQGSLPSFGATDGSGAEARLVHGLVGTLTDDFWSHWESAP